jgi:hypothetical protein
VSELAKSPSNPVRGLVYGTSTSPADFALGVKHLQMLGVSYLMLFSPQTEEMAAQQRDLKLIASVPDLDGQAPNGWKIYQVRYPNNESPLVTGLSTEPVVASVHAGNYRQCWGEPWTDTGSPMPKLGPWECAAAPWFMNPTQLDKVWTASGPKAWKRIDIKQLANTPEKAIDPTKVSGIKEDVDSISFHVSEVGKPVLVRTSYFPNWEVSGATGPYRVAPNMMVVVPTSHDVKLTYGLTKVDWLGRIATVIGIVGLVGLVMWKGAERYGATRRPEEDESESGAPPPDDAPPDDAPPGPGGPAEPGGTEAPEPVLG